MEPYTGNKETVFMSVLLHHSTNSLVNNLSKMKWGSMSIKFYSAINLAVGQVNIEMNNK